MQHSVKVGRADDAWGEGSTYEEFMGRWSRPLAEAFIQWMDAPRGGCWLDVGTGTGAVTAAIYKLADSASIVACDPSEGFIASARSQLSDPRVSFLVAGAGSLPSHPGVFDAVVSGLALNFFPDARAAIAEGIGLLRPRGWIGAVVWDYAEGMGASRRRGPDGHSDWRLWGWPSEIGPPSNRAAHQRAEPPSCRAWKSLMA